jgi:hypothetical protein
MVSDGNRACQSLLNVLPQLFVALESPDVVEIR